MSRFTGGDHLKPEDGLKYYIHQAMMVKRIVGRIRCVRNIKCKKSRQRSQFWSYPVRYRRQ